MAGSLLTGCAPRVQTNAAPERQGRVDLDALVRRHPGWRTVVSYDQALAGLHTTAAWLRPEAAATGTMALPAVTIPPGVSVPMHVRNAEDRRLAQAEQAQMTRLEERRTLARQLQVEQSLPAWYREARAQYEQAIQMAQDEYAQHLRQITVAQDSHVLNLTLQINALTALIARWSGSRPPAPGLDEARRQLTVKEAQRRVMDEAAQTALTIAKTQRDAAVSAARAARAAYVPKLEAQTTASLLAQDEAQETRERSLLSLQRKALLREGTLLTAVEVPPAGAMGTLALPVGQNIMASAQSQSGLHVAEATLAAQRARWIAFLYDDTRAAALDAARERRWTVTFARPAPGQADLTPQMAQALASGIWKL